MDPGVIEWRSRGGSDWDIHCVEGSAACSFGTPSACERKETTIGKTHRCSDSAAMWMSPQRGPAVSRARSGSDLVRVDDRRESSSSDRERSDEPVARTGSHPGIIRAYPGVIALVSTIAGSHPPTRRELSNEPAVRPGVIQARPGSDRVGVDDRLVSSRHCGGDRRSAIARRPEPEPPCCCHGAAAAFADRSRLGVARDTEKCV
jgi:hypothetical protein